MTKSIVDGVEVELLNCIYAIRRMLWWLGLILLMPCVVAWFNDGILYLDAGLPLSCQESIPTASSCSIPDSVYAHVWGVSICGILYWLAIPIAHIVEYTLSGEESKKWEAVYVDRTTGETICVVAVTTVVLVFFSYYTLVMMIIFFFEPY